ncbi:MAG: helix-turn-helix domain-containing protein [Chitinophagaceae bacterium]|nr:helix-turn-helix domain-containing protein [Chitinophagaceae bacterium]
MDLKEQIIKEYLEQGCGYRKLQAKYGIGRTTICKWVQIYQGVHGLDRTTKQQSHYLRDMDDPNKKGSPKNKSRLMICRKKLLPLKSNCNGKN